MAPARPAFVCGFAELAAVVVAVLVGAARNVVGGLGFMTGDESHEAASENKSEHC
jgi:hypothetical protein